MNDASRYASGTADSIFPIGECLSFRRNENDVVRCPDWIFARWSTSTNFQYRICQIASATIRVSTCGYNDANDAHITPLSTTPFHGSSTDTSFSAGNRCAASG